MAIRQTSRTRPFRLCSSPCKPRLMCAIILWDETIQKIFPGDYRCLTYHTLTSSHQPISRFNIELYDNLHLKNRSFGQGATLHDRDNNRFYAFEFFKEEERFEAVAEVFSAKRLEQDITPRDTFTQRNSVLTKVIHTHDSQDHVLYTLEYEKSEEQYGLVFVAGEEAQ